MSLGSPTVISRVRVSGPTHGSVTIVRDEYGVPHVFGSTLEAVWFGVGYAPAQDRLWQGSCCGGRQRARRQRSSARVPSRATSSRVSCSARRRGVPRCSKTLRPNVFHRNGKRIKTFRGAWEVACTAAGHPGMLVHDLRRSAVRNMERAGLSRSVAMQLTGHKTEAVYRRYAITSEADLREGVERLNAQQASEGRRVVNKR